MAFSYQEHHPFLLDSAYLPRSPVEMLLMPQQVGEMANASSYFAYPYSSDEAGCPVAPGADATAFDGSNSLDTGRNAPSVDRNAVYSPMASESRDDEKVPDQEGHMENKRKSRVETSLITGESNDIKKGRSKKQKRPRGGLKKKEEKKPKTDELKGSKACLDPSDEYVRVRARRGQATDSHSLAERVRREKISERMRMLQGLVPGCDKVTGKALLLDEIINYVQSLQNQVEFLSMKIASLSPILYDFNVDFVDCINQPQSLKAQKMMRSIPQTLPSVDQTNYLQTKAFDHGKTCYQTMDHSAPLLLQGPTAFSQDGGSAMQAGAFHDQIGFINMCFFQ